MEGTNVDSMIGQMSVDSQMMVALSKFYNGDVWRKANGQIRICTVVDVSVNDAEDEYAD